MPAIVKPGQPVDCRQRFQIADALLALAALAHRERQPPHQQQAKHRAAGDDVKQFRQDEQGRARKIAVRGVVIRAPTTPVASRRGA
jgi:hypothetical protein